MRLHISHKTTYTYAQSPRSVIQLLRLTPRHHETQYVMHWRLDVTQDCRLVQREDAFGNIVHAFTLSGPLSDVAVCVEGEVETQDANGLVRGCVERFPPALYLRTTPLTTADTAITDFAAAIQTGAGTPLERLHRLMGELQRDIAFDPDPTESTTTAAEAFALKRGVCQDLTHIFIAAARRMDIPTRYVSGHFYRADGVTDQSAGHAWAEAFVPDLGWVGFDPTNGICATEAHVRIAIGLDYVGASPVRGTRYGGGSEALAVEVRVAQTQAQHQN